MTEKEMEKIAELIVNKIGEMQKAYETEFKADMEELISNKFHVGVELIKINDLLNEEVAFLQGELENYIENEKFEKAGIIRDKIERLRKKYKL